MDEYNNIFEVLDAIEEYKSAIEEANVLKREILLAGMPKNDALAVVWQNTLNMIDYNIKFNERAIEKLDRLYKDWRDNA